MIFRPRLATTRDIDRFWSEIVSPGIATRALLIFGVAALIAALVQFATVADTSALTTAHAGLAGLVLALWVLIPASLLWQRAPRYARAIRQRQG